MLLNRREPNRRESVRGLPPDLIGKPIRVALQTGRTVVSHAFFASEKPDWEQASRVFRLRDFGEPIIRKALRQLPFFQFDRLKMEFPHLHSLSEWIHAENYLGNIQLELSGLPEQLAALSPDNQLAATVKALEKITETLSKNRHDYIGSTVFYSEPLRQYVKDRTVRITPSAQSDPEVGKSMSNAGETRYFLDLSAQDWFVYDDFWGTTSQKIFLHFIHEKINTFNTLYDEMYVIPNLQDFRWYKRENGQAFTPDFVLYGVRKQGGQKVHHQWWVKVGEGSPEQFWAYFQQAMAHPLREGTRSVAWSWPSGMQAEYGESGKSPQ